MRACILPWALAASFGIASGQEPDLYTRVAASPKLPFHGVPLFTRCSTAGCEPGPVSGVAIGKDGSLYEIQRGEKEPPVVVLDSTGHILRSWGKGKYALPHSIRLDHDGNVWTVDAASSTVIKYSSTGQLLISLHVGGQPDNGSPFNGTTDIAFGPHGGFFISDGYGNARILEYSAAGRKLGQWGKAGAGPGEFNLPHALRIAARTIYVADRENGRIERFNLKGRYLGEIAHLGRVYDLTVTGDVIWASMGPLDQPPGATGGWIVKLNRRTGTMLGHLDISEVRAGHGIEILPSGEPIITLGDHLLWFKAD